MLKQLFVLFSFFFLFGDQKSITQGYCMFTLLEVLGDQMMFGFIDQDRLCFNEKHNNKKTCIIYRVKSVFALPFTILAFSVK